MHLKILQSATNLELLLGPLLASPAARRCRELIYKLVMVVIMSTIMNEKHCIIVMMMMIMTTIQPLTRIACTDIILSSQAAIQV